jgi:flagellar motility protein MotE (MotC chaperone)
VIVTRQRRKPFPYKRLVLPLIAIALAAFALWWGPSRNAIAGGPLAPVWRSAGNWAATIAAPFHFAAQNQTITNLNRQIASLQSQLASAQNDGRSKEQRISQLQRQLDRLQTQAATARSSPASAVVRPAPAASAGAFGAGSNAAANATPDMKRTAAYWGAMDPDNASKVIQRLSPAYVARVLALMDPQTVGAILDALPPAYAAKLTQERIEARP